VYTEEYQGTFSSGYTIVPPPMWTEPDYYPKTTYYRVTAKVPTDHFLFGDESKTALPVKRVEIWRYDGTGWGASPIRIFEDHTISGLNFVKWNNKVKRFHWLFDDQQEPGRINSFFNTATGVFKLETIAGHEAVAVDFGSPRLRGGAEDYPNPIYSDVLFHRFEFGQGNQGIGPLIEATIINTKFTGVSAVPSERVNTDRWEGGKTEIRARLRMAPRNGIAMIVHRLDQANSQVRIGTSTATGSVPDAPAVVYVTGDVDRAENSIYMWGTLVVLGNWISDGEPILVYDEGFRDRLPLWLKQLMNGGGSTANTLLLEWKERPSSE
jgi:hypothetical protein